ncbi:protein of unknown function (plasmid) [Cupriavidus taiwanensis]|uniref:Uncharacterized protein n=1 Tax=Cupriavidus taiwanensis TaxID=164546 RepID=A0A375EE78_9BURK|nr:protein of unknown function [Cupriavidus taiwanensis]SOZ72247.1 protein of unknown function [Cupriavidus taiwanensis]SOZ74555.1 protein of unknown function [Cupriavidus taiwanensis]SPA03480.1 protein of unknown function [Cupriavidus taiwanensis]SPA12739.1 hypothetical protein CBM2625_U40008 [Cupriavidus taiwanensis]
MYGPSAVVSAVQLEHSFGEIDAKDIDFHDETPTCQVEVDSVHRREASGPSQYFLAVCTDKGLSIKNIQIVRRREIYCAGKPCYRRVYGPLPPFFSRKVLQGLPRWRKASIRFLCMRNLPAKRV